MRLDTWHTEYNDPAQEQHKQITGWLHCLTSITDWVTTVKSDVSKILYSFTFKI
jgi:hypothetical protein